jgi:hypothetical protein
MYQFATEHRNINNKDKMSSKVVCFVALLSVAAAYSHGFSSQHIYRHDGHAQPVYHGHGYDHGYGHEAHDYYVSLITQLL